MKLKNQRKQELLESVSHSGVRGWQLLVKESSGFGIYGHIVYKSKDLCEILHEKLMLFYFSTL